MKFSKRVVVMLVAGLILVGGAFLVVYPGGRRVAGDFRLVKEGDLSGRPRTLTGIARRYGSDERPARRR